jgi:alpha-N-arabinofuranosidase
MRKLALTILLICCCVSVRARSETVIEVDAAKPAPYEIPRTIYGTFLEPIGHSIYGGLWAQELENPSFEDNLWSADNIRSMIDREPALARSSRLGLPLPWEPLDYEQGVRYEPRWRDAANSERSLLIMALPEKETGVRQQVWLPVHRTLRYMGSLYARHLSGPPEIEISLRRRDHPETVLASADIRAGNTAWTRYEFRLELPPDKLAPLEPADFVVALRGDARALLDQVLLFPADNIDGMDPDMIALARDLQTPVVRFGGNFTSGYHWRDGIGPVDGRLTMLNQSWGMPEYNHFGTDELLDFCRKIGAAPQIALNLGSGTPEEAAGWVKYVDDRWNAGRGGLLWELGNELWGDFQIGYPTLDRIAPRTRTFSEAVRAVDANARLIATGQDPDHFREWNSRQLTLPAGTFQYLSTHFVVGTAEVRKPHPTPEFVALSAFALPVGLERKLREMYGLSHLPTAFTEWLFWARDDTAPRYYNMGGAICTAGFLNTLMRVAGITPVSDMTGLVEFGGIWKKRGQVFGTPAYWAFRMYSTADATTPVAVRTNSETYDIAEGNRRIPDIPGVPYLDVVAALNRDRTRLTLFAVNRGLHRDLRAQIRIAGFQPAGNEKVQTLSSGSIYDTNTESDAEAVHPVEKIRPASGSQIFPHASVTVIEWSSMGK